MLSLKLNKSFITPYTFHIPGRCSHNQNLYLPLLSPRHTARTDNCDIGWFPCFLQIDLLIFKNKKKTKYIYHVQLKFHVYLPISPEQVIEHANSFWPSEQCSQLIGRRILFPLSIEPLGTNFTASFW